jgi:uncharacterized protein YfiM (DUF2279 family)
MNKQLQQQNLRAEIKELYDTLKEQNGLAWKQIVRDYNNKQMEKKNDNKQLRYSNKVS